MPTTIWINGEYKTRDQASVSVFDHGLLYGDGVFEGIRAYGGRIFRLGEHIDRLFSSAKSIWLDPGMSQADMRKMVEEAQAKAGIKDSYIRLVITRGTGDRKSVV